MPCNGTAGTWLPCTQPRAHLEAPSAERKEYPHDSAWAEPSVWEVASSWYRFDPKAAMLYLCTTLGPVVYRQLGAGLHAVADLQGLGHRRPGLRHEVFGETCWGMFEPRATSSYDLRL
jgi:hypothetical protein